MTNDFLLNNVFAYREQRLRGRALARGLFGFYAVCDIDAAANVAFTAQLFAARWWLAAIGGALLGTVWSYMMASKLVWGCCQYRVQRRGGRVRRQYPRDCRA